MFFFDLDGTLIDSNGIWKQVDRDFLAKRGMPYTREYYEGVAHVPLPMAAEFTKAFCKLEESCEEIIAEWMDMSRNMYANVPLKPGVREYLEQCLAKGIPMALVTSSRSNSPCSLAISDCMATCKSTSPSSSYMWSISSSRTA